MTLAALEHQEINEQVEFLWRTLRAIAHYLMVHARDSEAFIHLVLMYTTDHIFTFLPIKYLINKDGKTTTPFKLSTGTKLSVSYLRVIYCPCFVWKATAHVGTNVLNMRHQVKKGFCGIFVGIPQHQKGYILYVPSKRNTIYSYDVVFDDFFSSVLAYTSWPYSEAMAMRPSVTYTPYGTSSREQNDNIITFAKFEEGGLLSETRDYMESNDKRGDKSDDNSIMPPLLSV